MLKWFRKRRKPSSTNQDAPPLEKDPPQQSKADEAIIQSSAESSEVETIPAEPTNIKYLGDNASEYIGNFLFGEGFPTCLVTKAGLLFLLDEIQGYTEEGRRLYPEIILTTSLKATLDPLPTSRTIEIETCELSEEKFKTALKRCAPLARDGWVIFLEVSGGRLRYGLVTAEASELSASLYRHLVGDLAVEYTSEHLAYIRAIGTKVIEVKGLKSRLLLSLSLKTRELDFDHELGTLTSKLLADLEDDILYGAKSFFNRLLEEATQESHGCIIGVAKDVDADIDKFKATFPDGVYLDEPINLIEFLKESEIAQTREASTAMRSYAAVVRRMIGHDGITLFSTRARIIGYNIFIHAMGEVASSMIGGARTRAFNALKESKTVICCFFKSQDGEMKVWETEHE